MSRTIRRIHPRHQNWHYRDYNIVKEIEHFGEFYDSNFCYAAHYLNVEGFYDEIYRRDPGLIVALKKAQAANDKDLWARLNGAGPIDLRGCKGYTEYEKRAWRQSFKQNKNVADYEDWDYVKYPKLRSFTWRQY